MTYTELMTRAESARTRSEARVILMEAQMLRQQSFRRLTAYIPHN